MSDWPAFEDPALRERLTLDHDAFTGLVTAMAGSIGAREFTQAIYERALGYPWARPASSFLLDGEDATDLEPVSAGMSVADDVARLLGAGPRRFPLLAFGSNGAPATLALKFAHLAPEQRRLVVTAGDLHDFDVGAGAAATHYGALPGTIFPSPGTAVRASVLWVTSEQFAALCWTEISYRLGRLDRIRFEPDVGGAIGTVFGFASRWGAPHAVSRPAAAALRR